MNLNPETIVCHGEGLTLPPLFIRRMSAMLSAVMPSPVGQSVLSRSNTISLYTLFSPSRAGITARSSR